MKKLLAILLSAAMLTAGIGVFSVSAGTAKSADISETSAAETQSSEETESVNTSETQTDETIEENEEINEAEEIEVIPEDITTTSSATSDKVTMNDLAVGNNTITIKWNRVSGASKYLVSYQRSYWNYWKDLKETSSLSYTDKNFSNGVTYRYRVFPLDSEGNILNKSYDIKSVTYRTTPSNIKASAITQQGKIKITWNKVEGCSKYQVFYRRSTQNNWKKCKGTASTNSYTDTGCSNNIIYYYTVRCLDGNGNYVSGYESGAKIHYYKIPENLNAVKQDNNGRIKITWGTVSGASKYQVFYKREGWTSWKKCKGYASSNSYTDTNCSSGVTYFYTVRACDKNGNYISSYDPTGAKITYTKTLYAAPSNIKAEKADNNGNIRITWNTVNGASKYQVFYKREGWSSWKKCKGYASSNSYTDTNCTSGVTYYYTVRACDKNGNYISSYDKTGAKITYQKDNDTKVYYFTPYTDNNTLGYIFKNNNPVFSEGIIWSKDGRAINKNGNVIYKIPNGKIEILGNFSNGYGFACVTENNGTDHHSTKSYIINNKGKVTYTVSGNEAIIESGDGKFLKWKHVSNINQDYETICLVNEYGKVQNIEIILEEKQRGFMKPEDLTIFRCAVEYLGNNYYLLGENYIYDGNKNTVFSPMDKNKNIEFRAKEDEYIKFVNGRGWINLGYSKRVLYNANTNTIEKTVDNGIIEGETVKVISKDKKTVKFYHLDKTETTYKAPENTTISEVGGFSDIGTAYVKLMGADNKDYLTYINKSGKTTLSPTKDFDEHSSKYFCKIANGSSTIYDHTGKKLLYLQGSDNVKLYDGFVYYGNHGYDKVQILEK